MRYLSHTPADVDHMLQTIGKPSVSALFNSIPAVSQLKRPLNLPRPLSEIELKTHLTELAGNAPKLSFLGAGATPHFAPEMVSQMLLRGEWLTAYTPYQPEVSQGTLQAIFEFQTMVASLLGCDVANASMYDGSTALAEALLMAARLKPHAKKVLLSRGIHPEYRRVCETILCAAGLEPHELSLDKNGITNFTSSENIAAVAYQTPNFLGQLESQKSLIEFAHAQNALAVAVSTEPVAFGLIHSPGTLGADIVVAEGLGLCGHLSLGAPGVGLFATSANFMRQMPGRLCGQTVDADGKRGFVLTLSTREQHIRREKATSNICTNHGLMALAFSMTMSLYGKTGFQNLAKQNLQKTLYFREQAQRSGLKIEFSGSHFNETVLRFSSERELEQRLHKLAERDIFAGVNLGRWYPEYLSCLLVSTTELHRDIDIDILVKGLAS